MGHGDFGRYGDDQMHVIRHAIERKHHTVEIDCFLAQQVLYLGLGVTGDQRGAALGGPHQMVVKLPIGHDVLHLSLDESRACILIAALECAVRRSNRNLN